MSSKVKRPCEEVFENCKTLIFDVEGTTTSISFVKDTLFPYVRSNLEAYIAKEWSSEELKTDLTLLREQAVKDEADQVEGCVAIPANGSDAELQAAVIANVLWQMDGDRKTKALKQLQGHIMRDGFKQGELKGHLYSDVAPALRAWAENGFKLYVYSSGSVEAQKLLFGHSEEGDLLKMFQGHFDTEVGPKQDVASYTSISKLVACSPSEVIFFTDVPAEAKAAEGAGMTSILVVREGNTPLSEEDRVLYQVIESFDGFLPESPLKRRKVTSGTEVLSTDVEMTEVSEEPTPVIPNTPVKPLENEATATQVNNKVETDVEKKTGCETTTMDESLSVTEKKECQTEDIEAFKSDSVETANTEISKPDDITKEVSEAEHTGKDQCASEKVETEGNIEMMTPVESSEPTKVSSTTVEVLSVTGSTEPETAVEKDSSDNQKVEEPTIIVASEIDMVEASRAIPEKEEEKVPEIVMDAVENHSISETAVSVQSQVSQADDTKEVKKGEAENKTDALNGEKEMLTEVKKVVEKKEVPCSIEENGEKMEESSSEPDTVVPKDTETIPKGGSTEEAEQKVVTDESISLKQVDVADKAVELVKMESADTRVEDKNSSNKNGIAETSVEGNMSEEMEREIECKGSDKKDAMGEKVSEKEMNAVETKVETDTSDKVVDTKIEKEEEEADKLTGIVEMGQGDAGTLSELSKNVENGKDAIQVEEIKVKKILVDNASDDTENAVPVTMET